MKSNGVEVYATCVKCHLTVKPLPLDPIIAKLGADYSLFDKRSRCPTPACSGSVIYLYRPGGANGTPYRPCTTRL